MGMRLVTPRAQIQNEINQSVDEWLTTLLDRLVTLGEYCYSEAINKITYTHRTGNLGSSTGYLVLRDGQIYAEGGFHQIIGPDRNDTTEDGTLIGRSYAESLIPEYSRGYVMLFVAGMNYASYVEAKGYNVITSGELYMQREAINILNRVL